VSAPPSHRANLLRLAAETQYDVRTVARAIDGASGRVSWPFIAWQMNRNSGSGDVSATVTSITYYSFP
jgi:hypothetical protein